MRWAFSENFSSKGHFILKLESITYYENYVVLNPGNAPVEYGELIDEDYYLELDEEYGPDSASQEDLDDEKYFIGSMGGSAIKKLTQVILKFY